jgi:hypothetical protein
MIACDDHGYTRFVVPELGGDPNAIITGWQALLGQNDKLSF